MKKVWNEVCGWNKMDDVESGWIWMPLYPAGIRQCTNKRRYKMEIMWSLMVNILYIITYIITLKPFLFFSQILFFSILIYWSCLSLHIKHFQSTTS